MNKGLVLPNAQWRDYTSAEVAALADLAPRTLEAIAYGNNWDVAHAAHVATYCQGHPGTRVIVRCYATGIPQWVPVDWAATCAARCARFGPAAECIPANELNLAVEGGSEDWAAQCTWLAKLVNAWWGLAPGRAIHLPALSPSGQYQAGWAAYHAAGLFGLFDIIDAHLYAPEQVWPGPLYQGGRPICVTEFNQMDPGTFLAAHGAARDCCYFILGGDGWPQYDLLAPQNAAAYRSFKEFGMAEVFSYGSGVAAALAARQDVATSNEHYLADSTGAVFMSITSGQKGEYHWYKTSGATYFFPKG